jgi:hypothetical protein
VHKELTAVANLHGGCKWRNFGPRNFENGIWMPVQVLSVCSTDVRASNRKIAMGLYSHVSEIYGWEVETSTPNISETIWDRAMPSHQKMSATGPSLILGATGCGIKGPPKFLGVPFLGPPPSGRFCVVRVHETPGTCRGRTATSSGQKGTWSPF